MFLIFINIEIIGNLKYTSGLQLVTSLKSELLHRYLLFLFLQEHLSQEYLIGAAFEAVLIISEIELALD